MANNASVRAGRAYVEIYADNSKFTAGLRQAESQLRNWGSQMSAISNSISAAFSIAPIAASLRLFSDFDDSMRAIAGTTQNAMSSGSKSLEDFAKILNRPISEIRVAASEMSRLETQARELGRTTSFTARQAADAMLILARAGFEIAEIQNTVGHVLNLARATGTDVAAAAQVAVAALRSFQIETQKAERVMDLLVATTNSSPQTLQNLGDSLKYIGPVAKAMNISLEETLQDLGLLAKFNLKGEQSGTAMRNLYMRMASSLNQQKFKESLGVDFVDADTGELKGLITVLGEANRKAQELGKTRAEIASLYKDVFSLRALPAAFTLAVSNAYEMQQALSDAKSEAYNTSEIMDSGIGGTLRRLKSRVEEFGIAIHKSFENALIGVGERFVAILDSAIKFINVNKAIIGSIVKIGAVVGGVALSLGAVGLAAGLFSKTLSGALGVARQLNAMTWGKITDAFKMLSGAAPLKTQKLKPFEIELSGIERARQATRYLDENLSSISKVTSRAIERFNRLSQAFHKVASGAPSFATAVDRCADKINYVVKALAAFRNDFGSSGSVFRRVRASLAQLSRPLAGLGTRLNTAAKRSQNLADKFSALVGQVEAAESAFDGIDGKLKATVAQFDALFQAAQKNNSVVGTYRKFVEVTSALQRTMRQTARFFKILSETSTKSAANIGGLEKSFAGFLKTLGTVANSSSAHVQSIEKIVAKYDELLQKVRATRDAFREVGAIPKITTPGSDGKGLGNYYKRVTGIVRASDSLIKKQGEIRSAVESIGATFQTAARAVLAYGSALQSVGALHGVFNIGTLFGFGKQAKQEEKPEEKPKKKKKDKLSKELVEATIAESKTAKARPGATIEYDVADKGYQKTRGEIRRAQTEARTARVDLYGDYTGQSRTNGPRALKGVDDTIFRDARKLSSSQRSKYNRLDKAFQEADAVVQSSLDAAEEAKNRRKTFADALDSEFGRGNWERKTGREAFRRTLTSRIPDVERSAKLDRMHAEYWDAEKARRAASPAELAGATARRDAAKKALDQEFGEGTWTNESKRKGLKASFVVETADEGLQKRFDELIQGFDRAEAERKAASADARNASVGRDQAMKARDDYASSVNFRPEYGVTDVAVQEAAKKRTGSEVKLRHYYSRIDSEKRDFDSRDPEARTDGQKELRERREAIKEADRKVEKKKLVIEIPKAADGYRKAVQELADAEKALAQRYGQLENELAVASKISNQGLRDAAIAGANLSYERDAAPLIADVEAKRQAIEPERAAMHAKLDQQFVSNKERDPRILLRREITKTEQEIEKFSNLQGVLDRAHRRVQDSLGDVNGELRELSAALQQAQENLAKFSGVDEKDMSPEQLAEKRVAEREVEKLYSSRNNAERLRDERVKQKQDVEEARANVVQERTKSEEYLGELETASRSLGFDPRDPTRFKAEPDTRVQDSEKRKAEAYDALEKQWKKSTGAIRKTFDVLRKSGTGLASAFKKMKKPAERTIVANNAQAGAARIAAGGLMTLGGIVGGIVSIVASTGMGLIIAGISMALMELWNVLSGWFTNDNSAAREKANEKRQLQTDRSERAANDKESAKESFERLEELSKQDDLSEANQKEIRSRVEKLRDAGVDSERLDRLVGFKETTDEYGLRQTAIRYDKTAAKEIEADLDAKERAALADEAKILMSNISSEAQYDQLVAAGWSGDNESLMGEAAAAYTEDAERLREVLDGLRRSNGTLPAELLQSAEYQAFSALDKRMSAEIGATVGWWDPRKNSENAAYVTAYDSVHSLATSMEQTKTESTNEEISTARKVSLTTIDEFSNDASKVGLKENDVSPEDFVASYETMLDAVSRQMKNIRKAMNDGTETSWKLGRKAQDEIGESLSETIELGERKREEISTLLEDKMTNGPLEDVKKTREKLTRNLAYNDKLYRLDQAGNRAKYAKLDDPNATQEELDALGLGSEDVEEYRAFDKEGEAQKLARYRRYQQRIEGVENDSRLTAAGKDRVKKLTQQIYLQDIQDINATTSQKKEQWKSARAESDDAVAKEKSLRRREEFFAGFEKDVDVAMAEQYSKIYTGYSAESAKIDLDTTRKKRDVDYAFEMEDQTYAELQKGYEGQLEYLKKQNAPQDVVDRTEKRLAAIKEERQAKDATRESRKAQALERVDQDDKRRRAIAFNKQIQRADKNVADQFDQLVYGLEDDLRLIEDIKASDLPANEIEEKLEQIEGSIDERVKQYAQVVARRIRSMSAFSNKGFLFKQDELDEKHEESKQFFESQRERDQATAEKYKDSNPELAKQAQERLAKYDVLEKIEEGAYALESELAQRETEIESERLASKLVSGGKVHELNAIELDAEQNIAQTRREVDVERAKILASDASEEEKTQKLAALDQKETDAVARIRDDATRSQNDWLLARQDEFRSQTVGHESAETGGLYVDFSESETQYQQRVSELEKMAQAEKDVLASGALDASEAQESLERLEKIELFKTLAESYRAFSVKMKELERKIAEQTNAALLSNAGEVSEYDAIAIEGAERKKKVAEARFQAENAQELSNYDRAKASEKAIAEVDAQAEQAKEGASTEFSEEIAAIDEQLAADKAVAIENYGNRLREINEEANRKKKVFDEMTFKPWRAQFEEAKIDEEAEAKRRLAESQLEDVERNAESARKDAFDRLEQTKAEIDAQAESEKATIAEQTQLSNIDYAEKESRANAEIDAQIARKQEDWKVRRDAEVRKTIKEIVPDEDETDFDAEAFDRDVAVKRQDLLNVAAEEDRLAANFKAQGNAEEAAKARARAKAARAELKNLERWVEREKRYLGEKAEIEQARRDAALSNGGEVHEYAAFDLDAREKKNEYRRQAEKEGLSEEEIRQGEAKIQERAELGKRSWASDFKASSRNALMGHESTNAGDFYADLDATDLAMEQRVNELDALAQAERDYAEQVGKDTEEGRKALERAKRYEAFKQIAEDFARFDKEMKEWSKRIAEQGLDSKLNFGGEVFGEDAIALEGENAKKSLTEEVEQAKTAIKLRDDISDDEKKRLVDEYDQRLKQANESIDDEVQFKKGQWRREQFRSHMSTVKDHESEQLGGFAYDDMKTTRENEARQDELDQTIFDAERQARYYESIGDAKEAERFRGIADSAKRSKKLSEGFYQIEDAFSQGQVERNREVFLNKMAFGGENDEYNQFGFAADELAATLDRDAGFLINAYLNDDSLSDEDRAAKIQDAQNKLAKSKQLIADKLVRDQRDWIENLDAEMRSASYDHESADLGELNFNKRKFEEAKKKRKNQLRNLIEQEKELVEKYGEDSQIGQEALARIAEHNIFADLADLFYEMDEELQKARVALNRKRFDAKLALGGESHDFVDLEFAGEDRKLGMQASANEAKMGIDAATEASAESIREWLGRNSRSLAAKSFVGWEGATDEELLEAVRTSDYASFFLDNYKETEKRKIDERLAAANKKADEETRVRQERATKDAELGRWDLYEHESVVNNFGGKNSDLDRRHEDRVREIEDKKRSDERLVEAYRGRTDLTDVQREALRGAEARLGGDHYKNLFDAAETYQRQATKHRATAEQIAYQKYVNELEYGEDGDFRSKTRQEYETKLNDMTFEKDRALLAIKIDPTLSPEAKERMSKEIEDAFNDASRNMRLDVELKIKEERASYKDVTRGADQAVEEASVQTDKEVDAYVKKHGFARKNLVRRGTDEEIEAERATLQEEASKLDEQYADVMEQMRSAGRDPYEAKYVMPGLRERAQSIRERRTANRNRQAELDGQEAEQNFAIQQIRESGKSRERRVRFDYEEDVADNLNRAFNNFDGKTREAQLRTEYYEMLQAANPDKDSPAAQFMVNQAKRAEAWERYQESSSMTSLNWSQMQEAWSNWQKTKNGNTTQEEKVAAYESFSKAQNEYYDSYSSVIQAMRSYNDASKVEREVTSSGTFNAFETMENHNDWQKENAIRQTEFLKAIAENTENGLF